LCANNADDDRDGLVDCIDPNCASAPECAAPVDQSLYREISLAGDFNNWTAGDSNFSLSYQGDGIWSGVVSLPAGFHEMKFTADGDWAVNWGGGQDDIVPPEIGVARQDGPNIAFELPLGGPYEVALSEESGAWSLSFSPALYEGLPPVGGAFLDLLTQTEGVSGSVAQQLANQFSQSFGEDEVPVVRGADVLFVVTEGMHDGVAAAGTFNDWSATSARLVPVAGGVGYVGRSLGLGQRHAYKFTDGLFWEKDPQNYEIEWDGFNPNNVGDFNSVFYTAGFVPNGRLRWLPAVESAALGNVREVYVALPPGYDQEPNRAYPTLYFQDGNESIVRSQMDQVVRDQILAGSIAPLIAVFVALPSQDQRFAEYTFGTPGSRGDLYVNFLASELVPLIDAQFRTLATPTARGVVGASLGGLISFRAGYERDDVFRRVGGQSSSFFWNNQAMISRIATGPSKPLTFYLDAGNVDGSCGSNDNCEVTRQMKQTLNARGYSSRHVEQFGADHDWFFWKQRLPGALQFLFPPAGF
jgi:enterochelin esterase family protein